MRRLILTLGTLIVLTIAGPTPVSGQSGTLRIERVFGPEVPTGRYKHPACLTELKNGDLYLVYYGGAGEYAGETAVFGSRLKKGSSAWSAPVAIARVLTSSMMSNDDLGFELVAGSAK